MTKRELSPEQKEDKELRAQLEDSETSLFQTEIACPIHKRKKLTIETEKVGGVEKEFAICQCDNPDGQENNWKGQRVWERTLEKGDKS